MTTALALLNPHAGRAASGNAAQALIELLGGTQLLVTSSSAEARERILALPPGRRVIVVGGDGTLQPLLGALQEREHELALLPMGSGNDLARALGLRGRRLPELISLLQKAPATPMDLGELVVDGREPQCFASSLGVGFDAAVGHRVQNAKLKLRGQLKYLAATFAELGGFKPWRIEVALDDEPAQAAAHCMLASCLNTPTYGAGMRAAPGARIDDGRLQFLAVRGWGRFTAPLALPLMLAGLHRGLPGITLRPFERASYLAAEPLPLLLDGEPTPAAARFTVGVRPRALKVVRA
jgi:diacylglycerol kinase family enzyme